MALAPTLTPTTLTPTLTLGLTCSSVEGIMMCALSGTRSRRWLTANTRMPGMSATHRSLPCITTSSPK
eukprot:2255844-Prymnesium_polylepis.1